MKKDENKPLLSNRRARHDYHVEWSVEAGLQLVGSEVKSLREARGVLADAYVTVKDGEAWLLNMQIAEYPWANRWNHAPKRDRKLLLNRRELEKLDQAIAREGYTALPLEVYLTPRGHIKALIGVYKGKKQHDHRQDARKREAAREIDRALSRRTRS